MINEIMNEYTHEEEEVHLEPQPETIANAEPEVEEPVEEERAAKKQRTMRHIKENETKGEKDFISTEA